VGLIGQAIEHAVRVEKKVDGTYVLTGCTNYLEKYEKTAWKL
jgi:hypothetical protein